MTVALGAIVLPAPVTAAAPTPAAPPSTSAEGASDLAKSGTDGLPPAEGMQNQVAAAGPPPASFPTLDECEEWIEDHPDMAEPPVSYWHQTRFSSCGRTRIMVEVTLTNGDHLGEVEFDLTWLIRGRNGQRMLDILVRADEWEPDPDENLDDVDAWDLTHPNEPPDAVVFAETWPGMMARFSGRCTTLFPVDDCGDQQPLGHNYAQFVFGMDETEALIYIPTTTGGQGPGKGDLDFLQDAKGYYTFSPELFIYHSLAISTTDTIHEPDIAPENVRCDTTIGEYGPDMGNGGCVIFNQDIKSYVVFDCGDRTMWESACFFKDALFDVTKTYPGTPDLSLPGAFGSGRPLTRNYYQRDGVPKDYRYYAQQKCKANWGIYTRRPNGDEAECDEYPFASTYQSINSQTGMLGNFAVRPTLKAHNGATGNVLKAFYAADRILDSDPFYVKIVGSRPADIPPWLDPRFFAPKRLGPVDGYTGSVAPAFRWAAGGSPINDRFRITVENAQTGHVYFSSLTSDTSYTADNETWLQMSLADSLIVGLTGWNSASPQLTSTMYTELVLGHIYGVPKVMVVGDSISHGMEGDETWRQRLKNHFMEFGTVVNFVGPHVGTNKLSNSPYPQHDGGYGVNNNSCDCEHLATWGWNAASAKNEVGPNVSTYQPDYLLVMLGFNDLGWGVNNPAGLRDDMRTLVENARAAKGDVRIMLANVVHRSPLTSLPNLDSDINAYNALLAGLVAEVSTPTSPVRLVDVSSVYNHATDTYDGLHPNSRGELKITKAFADGLAQLGLCAAFGDASGPVSNFTPAAPTWITATATDAGVTVSWAHSYGAYAYWLYSRNVTLNMPFEKAEVHADTWSGNWVWKGHTYEYYVVPVRGDAVGATTPSASMVANPKTSLGPTDIKLYPGSGYVDLTWSPPTGEFSSTVNAYRVMWMDRSVPGSWLQTQQVGAGTSARIGSLVNGHQYSFWMAAINPAGEGWPSAAGEVIPGNGTPATPTLLDVHLTQWHEVQVTWTPVAQASGYEVIAYFPPAQQAQPFRYVVGQVNTHTIGWLFDGAATFTFCVVALNGSLRSGQSNCIQPGVSAPTLTMARIVSVWAVYLEWTAVPGATNYRLWRRDARTAENFYDLGAQSETSRTVDWMFPEGGGVYEWCVQALTPGAESVKSNCLRSRLDAPHLWDARITDPHGVRLAWDPVPGNYSYNVYGRDRVANPNGDFLYQGATSDTFLAVGSLSSDASRWEWFVVAGNTVGTSPWSNIVRSNPA